MKRNYIILGCIAGATALAVLLLSAEVFGKLGLRSEPVCNGSADDITSNGDLTAMEIAEDRAPEIYRVEDLIRAS